MKKITFLLLIFTLTAFAQKEKNLIQNGSFEKSMENWTTDTESGSKATFKTDNSSSYSGQKALNVKVALLGKNTWNIHLIQPFPSKKNKHYEVTFYAKSDISGLELKTQVQNITFTHKNFSLTKQWKQYTWRLTAKENDLTLALHFIERGKYYVDNIVVKEVKKSKAKLSPTAKTSINTTASTSKGVIENGDFESEFLNWTNMAEGGSHAIYTINKETPYEGIGSMRVAVKKLGGKEWDVQSTNDINVKKNKRYKLSFYAKSSGSANRIRVQIQNNVEQIYESSTFSIRDTWSLYEWEFPAKSSAMQYSFHFFSLGTFEFDNIEIKQIKKKI